MNNSRIMLAATKSGSGKTTITCGLLAALKNAGINPCSFKCGPDYIDPMFHRTVLGIPSGNLDTFFTDDATTRSLFASEYEGDIAVIEGVMGLYDGVGGTEEIGSSYDLARALGAPIILIIDAKGAGRSVIAQLKGFLDYDKYNLIKGVILNRTTPVFGDRLGELIESELSIKYLGTVPQINDAEIGSRHLGLIIPEEIDEIQNKLSIVAKIIEQNINLSEVKIIADSASKLDIIEDRNEVKANPVVRLAVARDEAFCFYYRENIKLLSDAGVELIDFSPIRDHDLPDDIQGILLGGGYPENYLSDLSVNTNLKSQIKKAIENKMPVLAECGGFMYLTEFISDKDGKSFPMVGAIKGEASFVGKLVRFGYVILSDNDISIKGHEFHYYDTDNNGNDCIARKPKSDRQWSCIHKIDGSYIGFPHLYYPSNPDFVKNFVEVMKKYGGH